MRKLIIATAVVAAYAMPALAATHWYVVQDTHSHKCSVTSKKPTAVHERMVGKSTFKTEAAAHSAMTKDTGCRARMTQ